MSRFILILCISLWVLSGCGSKTETALRFEMERQLVQADRLQEQLKLKTAKLPEEDLNRLVEAYRKIAANAPALIIPSDIEKASEDTKQAWAIASLAITRIGTLYLNHQMYDKAFDSFKSVADNPSTTPIQKNAIINYMALALERLGRYREASAMYDSLASGYLSILVPQNPNLDALDAPIKSADMLMRAGDENLYGEKMNQAEIYYQTLINAHKGALMEAAAVGKLSGAYLQQTRFAEAIEILSTVRDDSTGLISPTILMTIADIYMNRLRDPKSAEKTYRDFLKYYPTHENVSLAQLGLGLSLFEQTRYVDARKALQGIEKTPLARHSTVAQAFYLAALCYEKEDKWELAKGQFDIVQSSFIGAEHAFEAALHVPAYYRTRGMTETAEKTLENSIHYIEKYAEENTANPPAVSRALGYLVRAYTESEDYIKASEQLALLHDRFPQLPEGKLAPLRLGELYETVINDTSKAIDWLRIFVQENPEAANINDIKNHILDLESRIGKNAGGG